MRIVVCFCVIIITSAISQIMASDEARCICSSDEFPLSWLQGPSLTLTEIEQRELSNCIGIFNAFNELLERDGKEPDVLDDSCPKSSIAELEKNLFNIEVQKGDKIFPFSNSEECWENMTGVAGYALMRGGNVIAYYINSRS